jgi:hypothetical protein
VTNIRVVMDTSVLLKWFHADSEAEVAESRLVHDAHRDGLLSADEKPLNRGLAMSATEFVAEHGDHIRKTP